MKSTTVNFRFEFVERVPKKMEEHVLYISLPFNMAMHLCPCGCGKEVANKISPARWALIYDGDTVSLEPSVRNSGIPCQSHYFITRNKIEWAFDSFEEGSEKTKKRKKKFKLFWRKKMGIFLMAVTAFLANYIYYYEVFAFREHQLDYSCIFNFLRNVFISSLIFKSTIFA